MRLQKGKTFLLFVSLLSLLYGGQAAGILAAEPPSMPVADFLSDRAADRLSSIRPSLVPAAPVGAPAPMQIPVGEADGGEQRGHILGPAPQIISDSTLDPVGNLGPAGSLPAIQSRVLSATETISDASALSGSPRQGVMTLDRGYRDAMPGGPPSHHP